MSKKHLWSDERVAWGAAFSLNALLFGVPWLHPTLHPFIFWGQVVATLTTVAALLLVITDRGSHLQRAFAERYGLVTVVIGKGLFVLGLLYE